MSEVRAKKTTEDMQHMRRKRMCSEGYEVKVEKCKHEVAGKEQKLKRELVEAKLDGTIFSPFYKVTMTPIYKYNTKTLTNIMQKLHQIVM